MATTCLDVRLRQKHMSCEWNRPMSCFNATTAIWGVFFATIFASFLVPYLFAKLWFTSKVDDFSKHYKLPEADKLPEIGSGNCVEKNGILLAHEISKRGNTSRTVVSDFTVYHYVALIGAITSAVLGGASAFLVAAVGWNSANEALQGMFLGSASSLALWLTMIQVFRYADTIAKHEAIYTSCSNLLSDLIAVLNCPPKLGRDGKDFSVEAYLREVASKCETIRTIGITFDGSKIARFKIDTTHN